MTLRVDEFIRRFLLHVLPKGFHRIRHYGLLASAGRKANLRRARELLAAPQPPTTEATEPAEEPDSRSCCPCCGGRMTIIETFERGTATAGTAGHRRADRDGDVVTRHDPHPHGLARRPRRPLSTRLHAPARAPLPADPLRSSEIEPSAALPRPSNGSVGPLPCRRQRHLSRLSSRALARAVPQNPIDLQVRPAGSFFGHFRTPDGARNSSRKQNGGFEVKKWERCRWYLFEQRLLIDKVALDRRFRKARLDGNRKPSLNATGPCYRAAVANRVSDGGGIRDSIWIRAATGARMNS